MAITSADVMKDALQNGVGHFCPVCRSSNLALERLAPISALHAEQEAGCQDCMSTWTISYAFSEILKLDTDDSRMSPVQLSEKYAGEDGGWGEHPDWPREDWQQEVANADTLSGYWSWVSSQIEQARG